MQHNELKNINIANMSPEERAELSKQLAESALKPATDKKESLNGSPELSSVNAESTPGFNRKLSDAEIIVSEQLHDVAIKSGKVIEMPKGKEDPARVLEQVLDNEISFDDYKINDAHGVMNELEDLQRKKAA